MRFHLNQNGKSIEFVKSRYHISITLVATGGILWWYFGYSP